jgi:glycosyltransferase involved in cell wall biosynthesis
MIKVLYINHYGVLGGAQRSMLEMVTNFPENTVEPYFVTPGGPLLKYLKKLNAHYRAVPGGISKFDHTKLGYYRGFRWFIILRELAYLFPTLYAFLKLKKIAREMDLIHINEITLLLPVILAKKMFKKPVVVHARVVFRNDPKKKRTAFVLNILNKYADHVIAIDENVADSLAVQKMTVIHNSFSHNSRFSRGSDSLSEKIGKINRGKLNIGFIGAIHPTKGIFELIEAIKICKDEKMDVRLLIVGSVQPGKTNVLHSILKKFGIAKDGNVELYSFIEKHQLEEYIYPLGRTSQTDEFYRFIDVICYPSFSDALGRSVFEAGFFHRPCIVAIDRVFPDTFIEGKTGLRVEAGNPSSIFKAIRTVYDNPEQMREMAEHAYNLSIQNFESKSNADKVLEIYKSLTGTFSIKQSYAHPRA